MQLGSSWLRNWIPAAFSIDLRSLALFRILLGILLLADLIGRAPDLAVFYTDGGAFSLESYHDHAHRAGAWSLHALGGSPAFQAMLFIVAGIAALSMLVGYRAKLSAVISFLLLVSLHARNPLVLNGGDVVMRVAHFWILFLPIGARWSVDSLRGAVARRGDTVLGIASAALLLQIAMIYWFGAALKTDGAWREDFTALSQAFANEEIAKPLAIKLLALPDLLAFLTRVTLALETWGPILAFLPIFTARFRSIAVVLFIAFHFVGIFLTLSIGLFPFIGAAVWTVFLPAEFWEKRGIPTIHAPPPQMRWSRLTNALAGVALLYVFAWNVRTLDFERVSRVFPNALNVVANVFGLSQKWSMFAPKPTSVYGWYLVRADTTDLLSGNRYTEEKPESVSATFKNFRWRKYLGNLRKNRNTALRADFVECVVGDTDASRIELVFMRLTSPGRAEPVSLHDAIARPGRLAQSPEAEE